jgi:HTH-type transcriptional regulator/antitoxin HigA
MANLKYTVVKSDSQYYKYCDILEELVQSGLNSPDAVNEYELLYLLISDWDDKHSLRPDLDPIELVKVLMEEHNLNQTELADIAGIGKSYVSQILHYKKR